MSKDIGGLARLCGRTLLMTGALGLMLAGIAVPSAMAEPKGEFKVFKECPVGTPGVEGCLVSRTESGELVLGNKKEAKEKTAVPIVTTQTLQGGFGEANPETGQQPFYGAKNGETLTKAAQRVPGGLLGIKCAEIKGEGTSEKELRKACEKTFEEGALGVYATLELAVPASDIYLNEFALEEELPYPPYPPALVLPAKIKLENVLFGSECYIGSSSEPIELALTTGATTPPAPNKSIHGKLGTLKGKEKGKILVITGNTLVGNAFAVGKAHGCGLFGILDGLIEAKLGLPSPAGENTAILNNTVEQANASAVETSEE
jgi:hypothetical protein